MSLRDVLSADAVHTAVTAHEADPEHKDCHIRSAIRSVFALLEGVTYFMKQTLLKEVDPYLDDYSRKVFKEERVDAAGNVHPFFPKPAENLRVFLEVVAFWDRSTWTLNTQDKGWQAYCELIEVRHRLMHPKKVEDLAVTFDLVEKAMDVEAWYKDTLTEILEGPKHPPLSVLH